MTTKWLVAGMGALVCVPSVVCVSSASFAKPAGGSSSSRELERGSMGPLPSERLAKPIFLTQRCSKIKVIEWRSTRGNPLNTGPSALAIRTLDVVCNYAVDRFTAFVAARGLPEIHMDEPISASVCLMPFRRNAQGLAFRNLNDTRHRFEARVNFLDTTSFVWGFFQRSSGNIYLRNDVLIRRGMPNKAFMHTFAHEIFHAMSYSYGLWHSHPFDKDDWDEQLARAFTRYIGFGNPSDFL